MMKSLAVLHSLFAIALSVPGFPVDAKANDCTTAVISISIPISTTADSAIQADCASQLVISRDDLGLFGAGLSLCIRRDQPSELVVSVEGRSEPDTGSPVHLADIRFQTASVLDVGVTGMVSFFDPMGERNTPKSAVQIVGTTTVAEQGGENPKVESITVRPSECLTDEKVLSVKTQKTEVHDELNVRTENVEDSYK